MIFYVIQYSIYIPVTTLTVLYRQVVSGSPVMLIRLTLSDNFEFKYPKTILFYNEHSLQLGFFWRRSSKKVPSLAIN